jgi:hypothetical protein
MARWAFPERLAVDAEGATGLVANVTRELHALAVTRIDLPILYFSRQ